MVGELGSTPVNNMNLTSIMNRNVTIEKRSGVNHNVQCPIVCGCDYWQSTNVNTARDLNHASSKSFNSERISHFMLLFFCLFVGIAVVHLKIRQIEIEENSRILSSQLDKVLKSVVEHELVNNIHNTKKSLSENTNDILSRKTLSSLHHRVTSTPQLVLRKKKNMHMPETYFDPNLMYHNSRNSNFDRSEVGGDHNFSNIDLDISVNTVNSSYPTQDSMSGIMLKKRIDKYFLYKSISPSRILKKLFSNPVKPNVPNSQWVEHISNYEDRKAELSESVTEGKLLSRVVRSNRRKGPVSLHFKGGVPERTFQDGGIIAPWLQDKVMPGNFGTIQFELKDGGFLEVLEAGMYLIYAQIYYLTTELHNSFAISIMESGMTQTLLALCSSNSCPRGTRSLAEVSCFTSVVRFLNASDQVFVLQRERNRRILMRDGQSFLGLVKLNSLSPKD